MQKKLITVQHAWPSRSMGPHVRQVIPSAIEHLDPFVFLDHFGPYDKKPGEQGVPPHPHAGIATITYLFSGTNRHQDSYRHEALIQSGDLAWMQAGKGIVHAEGMNEQREQAETIHGLQIWISLPAKDKFIEPDFYHYDKSVLPEFEQDGIYYKILLGELFGKISPALSLSPAYMYEIKIPSGKKLSLPIPAGYTCGVYTLSGALLSEAQRLSPLHIAGYETEGDEIELQAEEDSHILILGGKPLNEPIVGYASFIMNTQDQIRQVLQDYQAGKMGTVDWD